MFSHLTILLKTIFIFFTHLDHLSSIIRLLVVAIEIISQLMFVNGEIQIVMVIVNNVNVAFAKRSVIHVAIVHR